MANRTIYLRAHVVEGVNHLHLRDSEGHQGDDTITTGANSGDNVIWTLDSDSGISAITDILAKSGSTDLFGSGPSRESDTIWSGTIAENATGQESYSISYTLTDGTTLTDDPVVMVPPPGPPGS